MSVDTRKPGPGFDDQPALSMVKVHSDPAQVIVNHASFRVQLAPSTRPRPARPAPGGARGPAARRRTPVVWSGRSAPGDTAASGLLQAVRDTAAATTALPAAAGTATATRERGAYHGDGHAGTTTQVIPRVEADVDTAPTPLLPPMRQAVGAYDAHPPYHHRGGGPEVDPYDPDTEELDETVTAGRSQRHGNDAVRHAYYPGRRMHLGVVLLPLRVFLGFISIYAGMGKLCDPVYFDGGERGSMVKWLNSLHPWALAEPLRDFALSHPVGAGLTVAFLQVVVGVLTVLGLWQRIAASVGVLLSAALLLTVSWKTVPAYDAPDIIYLAAWSPLIIAGAPVYSIDGHLASEAWRRLGPRSELWELRRRVLRRGGLVAAVVVGLTLLIGSVLGGAVRSTEMVTVPGPNQDPTNHLPGSPLPQDRPSGGRTSAGPAGGSEKPSPSASRSKETKEKASPTAGTSSPARESGQVAEQPSQTQGTTGGQQAPRSAPEAPPASSSGPSSTGGGSGGTSSGGSSGGSSDDGSSGGGSTGGGSSSGGRVIGGLLG
ncbi:DoxX family membrane protein [Streptomyces sp. NPDC003860]